MTAVPRNDCYTGQRSANVNKIAHDDVIKKSRKEIKHVLVVEEVGERVGWH